MAIIEAEYQKLKDHFPNPKPYVFTHGDLDFSNIIVKDMACASKIVRFTNTESKIIKLQHSSTGNMLVTAPGGQSTISAVPSVLAKAQICCSLFSTVWILVWRIA
jgi:hypothetical protein